MPLPPSQLSAAALPRPALLPCPSCAARPDPLVHCPAASDWFKRLLPTPVPPLAPTSRLYCCALSVTPVPSHSWLHAAAGATIFSRCHQTSVGCCLRFQVPRVCGTRLWLPGHLGYTARVCAAWLPDALAPILCDAYRARESGHKEARHAAQVVPGSRNEVQPTVVNSCGAGWWFSVCRSAAAATRVPGHPAHARRASRTRTARCPAQLPAVHAGSLPGTGPLHDSQSCR